jgi:NADH-quinone oxidoreductase subunit M
MLKMFQNVMLGETNTKLFADVTTTEIIVFVIIIAFLLFYGLYPKPIVDLVMPSIKETLIQINRFN